MPPLRVDAPQPSVRASSERDRDPAPCQLAGGVDPGVPAADDDDVRGVRQRPTRSIGECRHRRAPQRAPLEVGVHVGRGHRRSVGHRRLRASAAPDRATRLDARSRRIRDASPRNLRFRSTNSNDLRASCSARRVRLHCRRTCATVVAWPMSPRETCATTRGPARSGRGRRIDHDHGRRAACRHTRARRTAAALHGPRPVRPRRADATRRSGSAAPTSETSRPTPPTTSRCGDHRARRHDRVHRGRIGSDRPDSIACPTVSPSRSSPSVSSGPASSLRRTWPAATAAWRP